MCQATRENRMTKDEFMEIQIKNFASIIELSERLKVQSSKRKPRIFSVGKMDKDTRTKSKSKMKV